MQPGPRGHGSRALFSARISSSQVAAKGVHILSAAAGRDISVQENTPAFLDQGGDQTNVIHLGCRFGPIFLGRLKILRLLSRISLHQSEEVLLGVRQYLWYPVLRELKLPG